MARVTIAYDVHDERSKTWQSPSARRRKTSGMI
jgi:hypothetical protein